jgi:hypothetical protein
MSDAPSEINAVEPLLSSSAAVAVQNINNLVNLPKK